MPGSSSCDYLAGKAFDLVEAGFASFRDGPKDQTRNLEIPGITLRVPRNDGWMLSAGRVPSHASSALTYKFPLASTGKSPLEARPVRTHQEGRCASSRRVSADAMAEGTSCDE